MQLPGSLNLSVALIVLHLARTWPVAAQVQVRQEPRHHNVYENEWVRILDVHIPPGDTSLFHKHSTPSVFMVLSNTRTGSEVLVEPAKIHLTDGNIWFEGFYDKPRVHRVWNSDTTDFHVIDMELIAKEHPTIHHYHVGPPMDSAADGSGVYHFKLLFDEQPVRAYRFSLHPNAFFHIANGKAPWLIVKLDDDGMAYASDGASDYTKVLLKKGNFAFIRPGGMSIRNAGQSDQDFVLFELK